MFVAVFRVRVGLKQFHVSGCPVRPRDLASAFMNTRRWSLEDPPRFKGCVVEHLSSTCDTCDAPGKTTPDPLRYTLAADRRMHHPRRVFSISLAALVGAPFLPACGDDGPNCQHRVCDIGSASCTEFVAEVIACQRDVPVVYPNVRFVTHAQLIAEREQPTPEQLDFERDYWAGEALVGLMPENYNPANADADSLAGVAAQYHPRSQEIVIVSDSSIDDERGAYLVLVHEMLHAQQDAEYDLEALGAQYATTFPRSLGLRAAIEGEASFYTAVADLELLGHSPHDVDWNRYYAQWQDDALHAARETEVPSLHVVGLFAYAFGSEQIYRAWGAGGLDEVRNYVQNPPDSVRQIMAGYAARPPQVFNLDTVLDPHAVPILEGHTYLSGGAQDVWLLNTMLQRTTGSTALWSGVLGAIEADHLSVWRNDESGSRVAVWRIQGPSSPIESVLTEADSRWTTAPEQATTHFMRAVGDDWVLVASETLGVVAIADAITGWQSQDQARASAELVPGEGPRGLVLGPLD